MQVSGCDLKVEVIIQTGHKLSPRASPPDHVPVGFDEGDLRISARQLRMYVHDAAAQGSEVPFKALQYAIGECNYGGRWDGCIDACRAALCGLGILSWQICAALVHICKRCAAVKDVDESRRGWMLDTDFCLAHSHPHCTQSKNVLPATACMVVCSSVTIRLHPVHVQPPLLDLCRVTDDKDRRLLMTLMTCVFSPDLLTPCAPLADTEGGHYHVPRDGPLSRWGQDCHLHAV